MWDAAVIGGGPAGAATALHLARKGCAVCLIDRARFPRDKPCGEFLSPAATPLLDELGVRNEVEAAGARRLSRIRIVVHHARPLDLSFPDGGPAPPWGYALSRRRLDAILLAAAARAGVRVRTGLKVEGLLWAGDRVTGAVTRERDGTREPIRARLVIGAGGRNCPVARALGLQRRVTRRRFDLLAHWSGTATDLAGDGVCEIRVGPGVYAAAAPIEGGRRNVNCVVSRDALRRAPDPEAMYHHVLGSLLADTAWLAGTLDGSVTTSDVTPLRTTRATAEGAMLVGDSALFLDPLTGQGLYLALRSAALAAPVAAAALAAGNTSRAALAIYDRRRREEFHAKRRVSQALQAILFRRRLAVPTVRALASDPVLAGTFAAATADMIPARRVWSVTYGARLARCAGRGYP